MNGQKHDHREAQGTRRAFFGYAPPTSSTTYTPNQFFDVVLPHASRGCLRLVAYLIRKTLGWSDQHGNPQNPEAYVSYRELIDHAGISRGAIKDAIQEALDKRFIQCLRFGQPHRPGEEGFSALYSLKWDEQEKYIADPEKFDGFFAGNGNLTHIPNDFFDYTIPNEPLAVVQVIGVIIRNTIGFQTKFGFRVQEVSLSFSDIMRRTRINSRTTVSNALKAAVEGCHIRRVEHGVFDRNAGVESKATVYAIRWSEGDPEEGKDSFQPTLFELEDDNGSKTGPAISPSKPPSKGTVQKLDRSSTVQNVDRLIGIETGPVDSSESGPATVQNLDSNEFKNRTDIKTTNLNNSSKQQHQTEPDVVGGSSSLALLIGKLMAQGIEATAAARLVDSFPAERIERQLEWIGLRDVKASRTGLLIRAIERDMPRPGVQTSERSTGWIFAAHFYAELAGNPGEPTAEPSSEDTRLANGFLGRLPALEDAAGVARQFARLVKNGEKGKASPVRTLTLALRLYSDEHFASVSAEIEKAEKNRAAQRRKDHEALFTEDYHRFKIAELRKLEADASLMEAFEEEVRQKVRKAHSLSPTAGRRREEAYADPVHRGEALLEFATSTKKFSIPTFWEWDATINERPFSTEGTGE